jgi:hypothetical protein
LKYIIFLGKERGSQVTITIKAARDAEAGVWYIADSGLPGLNLEGETSPPALSCATPTDSSSPASITGHAS